MKSFHKITGLSFLILILILPSLSRAQDPGAADTVQLTALSESFKIDENSYHEYVLASMPLNLFNDEDISAIVIPLVVDGSSGWAKFDSLSYGDSRLADPAILDLRDASVFATDTFSVDSLVLTFEVSTGNVLPAGDGKLCDLWFTLLFGGEVIIDSLPDSPRGGLRLTAASRESFTPQFQPGLIDIACDYLIGDLNQDGAVNVGDLLWLQKAYHGCHYLGGPAFIADMNCDRHVDLRDALHLVRYVFAGGTICDCGDYAPAVYNDPGLDDVVWIYSDTLFVGCDTTIALGIINDEPLSGLAMVLEWDGSAVLDFVDSWWYVEGAVTDRIPQSLDLRNYMCDGENGVNPDSLHMFTFEPGIFGEAVQPGNGEICFLPVTPVSAGMAAFRLVSFVFPYDSPFSEGPESMLLTGSEEAILPVLVGGRITVRYLCGDANSDCTVNVGDAVFIINYVFKNGPAPDPLCLGDANGDTSTNVGDAVYLINYVFKDGPSPVPDCCPQEEE